LTLSLGLISLQVDLETAAPRQSTGLNRICSEHAVKLHQKYECPGTSDAEAHDVAWGSWNLGYETADGYKVVNQELRPKVEASPGLTLVPVPIADLQENTFEGEGIYYASPASDHVQTVQVWQVFNTILQKNKTALITKGALRGGTNTEKLWRLQHWNGYIVLREIQFPENIKPSPEVPDVKVQRELVKVAETAIESMTSSWENFDSTNTVAQRLQEWMNEGSTVEAGVAGPAVPELDLMSAFQQMIESS